MTPEDTVFDTKYGKFAVSPQNDGRTFERFKKGVYLQTEDIELLSHFITPDTTVVDIGAHIGTMTIPFAKRAKKVFSFEPVPTTRAYLERNIALNNLQNVTVLPFALGSKDAEAFIHVGSAIDAGQNSVAEDGEIPISIRKLDDQIKEAEVIKLDAEGLESEIVAGGSTLLKSQHPIIFCEINYGQLWSHHTSPAKLETQLRMLGYSIYMPLGANTVGLVRTLSLLTGLSHPAFFLGRHRNYAFDIVAALPKDIPQRVKVISSGATVLWTLRKRFLKRIFR